MTLFGKRPFENTVGKVEIACKSNFFFSHHVFYSIKDRNDHFSYIFVTFNLLSANASNLVWSKILSCGNGLKQMVLVDHNQIVKTCERSYVPIVCSVILSKHLPAVMFSRYYRDNSYRASPGFYVSAERVFWKHCG